MTDDTRIRLIAATRACLLADGHANLSTRRIADRAGVPLSQIHYHFGGRRGLVLALLAQQNDELLRRQESMYSSDEPLSRRYQQACDFLDIDLDSGYVRILHEMIAIGWSDDSIGREATRLLQGWFDLLERVVDDAGSQIRAEGHMAAHDLATLIGLCFLGGESMVLLDPSRREAILAALRSLGSILTSESPAAAAGSSTTA